MTWLIIIMFWCGMDSELDAALTDGDVDAVVAIVSDKHYDSRVLLWALANDDKARVRTALRALMRIRSDDSQHVVDSIAVTLDRASREGDLVLYRAASYSLARQGPRAVPILARALDSMSAQERRIAVSSLAVCPVESDSSIASLVLGALGDRDWDVRACAVEYFEIRWSKASRELLLATLGDGDPFRSIGCATAIFAHDPTDHRAVNQLVAHMRHVEASVRAAAVEGLTPGRVKRGQLERHATALAPALALALKDSDENVRIGSARAASALGKNGTAVSQALVAACQDSIAGVRTAAICALGDLGIGDEDSIRVLLSKTDDPDADVRVAACVALGQLRISTTNVVASLKRAASDSDPDVRRSATAALATVLRNPH